MNGPIIQTVETSPKAYLLQQERRNALLQIQQTAQKVNASRRKELILVKQYSSLKVPKLEQNRSNFLSSMASKRKNETTLFDAVIQSTSNSSDIRGQQEVLEQIRLVAGHADGPIRSWNVDTLYRLQQLEQSQKEAEQTKILKNVQLRFYTGVVLKGSLLTGMAFITLASTPALVGAFPMLSFIGGVTNVPVLINITLTSNDMIDAWVREGNLASLVAKFGTNIFMHVAFTSHITQLLFPSAIHTLSNGDWNPHFSIVGVAMANSLRNVVIRGSVWTVNEMMLRFQPKDMQQRLIEQKFQQELKQGSKISWLVQWNDVEYQQNENRKIQQLMKRSEEELTKLKKDVTVLKQLKDQWVSYSGMVFQLKDKFWSLFRFTPPSDKQLESLATNYGYQALFVSSFIGLFGASLGGMALTSVKVAKERYGESWLSNVVNWSTMSDALTAYGISTTEWYWTTWIQPIVVRYVIRRTLVLPRVVSLLMKRYISAFQESIRRTRIYEGSETLQAILENRSIDQIPALRVIKGKLEELLNRQLLWNVSFDQAAHILFVEPLIEGVVQTGNRINWFQFFKDVSSFSYDSMQNALFGGAHAVDIIAKNRKWNEMNPEFLSKAMNGQNTDFVTAFFERYRVDKRTKPTPSPPDERDPVAISPELLINNLDLLEKNSSMYLLTSDDPVLNELQLIGEGSLEDVLNKHNEDFMRRIAHDLGESKEAWKALKSNDALDKIIATEVQFEVAYNIKNGMSGIGWWIDWQRWTMEIQLWARGLVNNLTSVIGSFFGYNINGSVQYHMDQLERERNDILVQSDSVRSKISYLYEGEGMNDATLDGMVSKHLNGLARQAGNRRYLMLEKALRKDGLRSNRPLSDLQDALGNYLLLLDEKTKAIFFGDDMIMPDLSKLLVMDSSSLFLERMDDYKRKLIQQFDLMKGSSPARALNVMQTPLTNDQMKRISMLLSTSSQSILSIINDLQSYTNPLPKMKDVGPSIDWNKIFWKETMSPNPYVALSDLSVDAQKKLSLLFQDRIMLRSLMGSASPRMKSLLAASGVTTADFQELEKAYNLTRLASLQGSIPSPINMAPIDRLDELNRKIKEGTKQMLQSLSPTVQKDPFFKSVLNCIGNGEDKSCHYKSVLENITEQFVKWGEKANGLDTDENELAATANFFIAPVTGVVSEALGIGGGLGWMTILNLPYSFVKHSALVDMQELSNFGFGLRQIHENAGLYHTLRGLAENKADPSAPFYNFLLMAEASMYSNEASKEEGFRRGVNLQELFVGMYINGVAESVSLDKNSVVAAMYNLVKTAYSTPQELGKAISDLADVSFATDPLTKEAFTSFFIGTPSTNARRYYEGMRKGGLDLYGSSYFDSDAAEAVMAAEYLQHASGIDILETNLGTSFHRFDSLFGFSSEIPGLNAVKKAKTWYEFNGNTKDILSGVHMASYLIGAGNLLYNPLDIDATTFQYTTQYYKTLRDMVSPFGDYYRPVKDLLKSLSL
jgi:hypothetical protein